MSQPEPEPRRVEPTGDPRVDALIDAMVCPSCRTIYNAAKAKCSDLWHHDNQLATGGIVTQPDCHLTGMHPADCPAYVAGIATLRERLTTAPIRLTRSAADERDSLARRLSVRFAEAEELRAQRAQLAQLRDERDAAHAAGVAAGRRQATEGWKREWGVEVSGGGVTRCGDEGGARWVAEHEGGRVVSRLVGSWEPAEVTSPLEPLIRIVPGAPSDTLLFVGQRRDDECRRGVCDHVHEVAVHLDAEQDGDDR